MTIAEYCFGPKPTITPSDAARALGAEKRRADRARRDETTALLIASNASGYSAGLGWR